MRSASLHSLSAWRACVIVRVRVDGCVLQMFKASDINGDGKMHYVEFVESLAKDQPLLRAIAFGMNHK